MAGKMKIPSEDSVLEYLRRSRRGPMKAKEIAKGLAVAPHLWVQFIAGLQQLEEQLERRGLLAVEAFGEDRA